MWGPSIPVCTCAAWNEEGKSAVGFQLGYGDENTSVILYDETTALRLAVRRARRRLARSLTSATSPAVSPLAVARRKRPLDLHRLAAPSEGTQQ